MPIGADTIRSIFPEIAEIKDKELQEKIVTIWQEACVDGCIEDLMEIPKNLMNIGYTLVNHTRVVTGLCKAAAGMAKALHNIDVNMDYLLAGALLHDVSKLLEITSERGNFKETEFGKKIQHGFYAGYQAFEKGLPMEVQHMLIAHTPKSAVMPQSIEAVILYYMDYADTEILNQSLGVPLTPKR